MHSTGTELLIAYLGVLGVVVLLVLRGEGYDEELVRRVLNQLHSSVRKASLFCPLLSSPELNSLQHCFLKTRSQVVQGINVT
jgi:predicted GNAT family acetyltransferase